MTDTSRRYLLENKSGFNQMRNLIYHLQRYMKQYNLNTVEITERYFQMGKNIGTTFEKDFKPISKELKDLIPEIYETALLSKVKLIQEGFTFKITEDKCPLCKYQYKDIETPGCTVSVGMVSSLLEKYGFRIKNAVVLKSKTFGDEECVHEYEIEKK